MRLLADLKDVLRGGDEAGTLRRRITHCFGRYGFESVFLSVRPIVLSLACSTMFSSTTASSSSLRVRRALRPRRVLHPAWFD